MAKKGMGTRERSMHHGPDMHHEQHGGPYPTSSAAGHRVQKMLAKNYAANVSHHGHTHPKPKGQHYPPHLK
jgi:hypothetical protein